MYALVCTIVHYRILSHGYNLHAIVGSSKVIKGEWGQSSHMINQDSGSILNAVNAEPSDFESPYQTAATVSCVVPTDNDRFLVRH